MIWNRLREFSEASPDRIAVVGPKDGRSYGQLLSAAGRTAALLKASGCGHGDRVALFLPNGFGFVQAIFGTIRSGAVAVPLNTGYQADEAVQYLQQSRPRIVITDRLRQDRIETILSGFHKIQARPALVVIEEADSTISGSGTDGTAASSDDPDRPVLLQYSTGSTGRPKPVVRTERQLMAEVDHFHRAVKVRPGDRILGVLPLFHAYGFGSAMLAALMNGATLVVRESFDPREVMSILRDETITLFPGVPFMFQLLAEMRHHEPIPLDALRICFSAGAPLHPQISRRFQERFGTHVRQLYGCTEAGSVTFNLDSDIEATLESVGKPLPSVEVGVFDESGSRLKAGTTGEIGFRSPAMAREYEGMAEATKEAFRFGFFFPGDLGCMDGGGRLYITGRKTFFINVGGNKVDPAEVEEAVRRHSKVKDVVVVGVESPYGGETVKAIIVAEKPFGPEEIREICAGRLADYKIPKIVEFRREIPRSPLGKVLRKHLV